MYKIYNYRSSICNKLYSYTRRRMSSINNNNKPSILVTCQDLQASTVNILNSNFNVHLLNYPYTDHPSSQHMSTEYKQQLLSNNNKLSAPATTEQLLQYIQNNKNEKFRGIYCSL